MNNIANEVCECGSEQSVNEYDLWFGNLERISQISLENVYDLELTPEDIYKMTSTDLKGVFKEEEVERIVIARKFWDLNLEKDKLIDKGISFSSYINSKFPDILRHYHNPPRGLYYCGGLPNPNEISVSIVGARKCTPYGREMAVGISKYLAKQNVQVISGMAMGVDGFAHKGALDGGGKTYAILGNGVDICYPQSNIGIFTEIPKKGGVISEYPPGMKALAHNFPERNRIISGLSDIVIVVEAEEKSGSLITADFALEQGKDVIAIPGKATDKLSAGCNYLIYQGAEIYLGLNTLKNHLERLWEEKGISEKIKEYQTDKKSLLLEKKETMVYSCLSLQPKRMENLLMECPLTFAEIQGILLDLQLKGCVKEVTKNHFIKCEI